MLKSKKILVLAAVLFMAFASENTVYGTESDMEILGSISAKVYQEQSVKSGILANLIVGNVFQIADAESDASGAVWYYVVTDFGIEGYVQKAEMDNLLQAAAVYQQITQIQDNTPHDTAPQTQKGEVVTLNSINLRKEPSTESDILERIEKDTLLEYSEITQNADGEKWYKVSYEGIEGYVSESTVKSSFEEVPENNLENEQENISQEEIVSEEITNEEASEEELINEEIDETAGNSESKLQEESQQTIEKTIFEVNEKDLDEKNSDKKGIDKKSFNIKNFILPFLVTDLVFCTAILIWLIKRILKLLRS